MASCIKTFSYCCRLVSLVLLLAVSTSGEADLIEITGWDTQGGEGGLPPRGAVVGDTVRFNWLFGNIHNVYIHPDFNCDIEGRILVGEISGANFTFTQDDVGKYFFVCDAFDHCNRGLHITFTVVETKEELQKLEDEGYFIVEEPEDGASNLFASTITGRLALASFVAVATIMLWN